MWFLFCFGSGWRKYLSRWSQTRWYVHNRPPLQVCAQQIYAMCVRAVLSNTLLLPTRLLMKENLVLTALAALGIGVCVSRTGCILHRTPAILEHNNTLLSALNRKLMENIQFVHPQRSVFLLSHLPQSSHTSKPPEHAERPLLLLLPSGPRSGLSTWLVGGK